MSENTSLPSGNLGEYHRPNQKWACGALASCENCPGPNAKGVCPSKQCTPQLSLRHKRARLTIAITCLTIGILVVIFASNRRNDWIAPGELCSSHSHLFNDANENRCAACHSQANETFGQWFKTTLTGHKSIGPTQSDLCLKCHDGDLGPNDAKGIHNSTSEMLAQLSAKFKPRQFDVRNIVSPPNSNGHTIACATCHKEHQGTSHQLTMLTDQQCQSCHTRHFHSFERDHPEFSDWPFVNNRNIAFDHQSHLEKHFPSKGKSMDCRDCHISDDSGKIQMVRPFEQSCAECHDTQIKAGMGERHQLLALPMLDLEAFQQAGISIGQWPETAAGAFDGTISPLMQILLLGDNQANSVLRRLPPGFQFGDIDPGDPKQLEQAGELAWAIKRLLFELANDSETTFQTRLAKVIGEDFDANSMQGISAQMHPALFREAQRYWMPGLALEMQLQKSGSPAQTIAVPIGPNSIVANTIAKQDEVLAPNPLVGKPEYSSDQTSGNRATAELPKVNNLQENAKRLPNQMTRNPNQDQVRDQARQAVAINDDELLAENPLKEWAANPNAKIKRIPDPTIVENSQNPRHGNQGAAHQPPPTSNSGDRLSGEQLSAIAKAMRQLADAGHSRWIRNDLTMSIDYLPDGHADPVIKAWYEVALNAKQTYRGTEIQLMHEIANPQSQWGTCSSCHSFEHQNKNRSIEWQASYRDPYVRNWTNFSHGPHLVTAGSADCQSCHVIRSKTADKSGKQKITQVSFSEQRGISDFCAIEKQSCTSCHNNNGASNRCSTCHSYHVGSKIRTKTK